MFDSLYRIQNINFSRYDIEDDIWSSYFDNLRIDVIDEFNGMNLRSQRNLDQDNPEEEKLKEYSENQALIKTDTCPICFESLETSTKKYLYCGHCFCTKDLHQMWKKSYHRVKCPMCRKISLIDDLSKLRIN